MELRRARRLDHLDELIEETAAKVDAAVAFSAGEDFAYMVAAASGRRTIRMVFPPVAGDRSAAAEEAAARCGHDSFEDLAAELSSWSAVAPHATTAEDVVALASGSISPEKVVEGLSLLLGMTLPSDRIPDPLELQSVAREHLNEPAEAPKPRRGGFWRAR